MLETPDEAVVWGTCNTSESWCRRATWQDRQRTGVGLRASEHRSASSLQHFMCGLAAGTLAKLATHPLDVAKKRFQVHTLPPAHISHHQACFCHMLMSLSVDTYPADFTQGVVSTGTGRRWSD